MPNAAGHWREAHKSVETGKAYDQGRMRTRAVVLVLAVLWSTAGFGNARQKDTFEIAGVLRDATGHVVPGASVHLRREGGAQLQERKTDSAGNFVFPDLNAGSYVVSASKGNERSEDVLVGGKGGVIEHVELKLGNGANRSGNAKNSNGAKTSEMEFSDLPTFTIAGVTDWTAAGGHGSDTNLRISESLTRETLGLKAEPNVAHPADTASREQSLRKQLETSPRDPRANEELGRLYLNAERYSEAVGPLEIAYELDPTQRENEYNLALALDRSGDPRESRVHVDRLLAAGDKPEWHRLAGEVDEKLGDALGAVQEFNQAIKKDPSEENYFAWGTELLEHRAIWQAKEVFESAVKAYPNSQRLLTALGTALFSAALYKEGAERLCQASDLNPNDAEPYLFMGKMEIASPDPLPCIEAKLQRFVNLRPADAVANYYFAMAYWKQAGRSAPPETLANVERFLSKAVEDDPKCSSAYLQLGVIQASRSNYKTAAEYYRKAIEADPSSSEAHFRLGVAYDRLGEKDKAAPEFQLHDELEKKQAAAVDRQRREVKQFLVLLEGNGENKSTQP